VHTIGDITHVTLLGEITTPDVLEHLLGDLTVKPADAVDLLTGVAREGAHAELLAVIVGVLTSHANKLVPRDAEHLGIATHVLAKETFVEVVVTCGNGRMDSIERRSAHEFECLIEGETFVDIVNKTLNVAESSMALVAVVDVLLYTQFLEQEDATDTEQNLLLEAVLPITTIEGVGDRTVVLRVEIVVSIEQVELDTAYIDTPNIGVNLIVHVGNINDEGFTIFVHLLFDGEAAEVLGLIVGNLLTIHREGLCEIAKTIEEAYGDHVDIGVGCFFDIIACEDTKTTRVNLENLIEAILHTEISYAGTILTRLDIHVVAKLLVSVVHAFENVLVLSEFRKFLVAETFEHEHGILTALLIEDGVEVREEATSAVIPSPPHIMG
jgi:hypothetical protein